MWGSYSDTTNNRPAEWRYCHGCQRRDRDTGRCPVKGMYVAPWDNACGRHIQRKEDK